MTALNVAGLERAVESLPRNFPGPGGAVAVVKDGKPIMRHAWGFANLERQIPFTASTVVPFCSITKQFTCAALLAACPDPAALDAAVLEHLPQLQGEKPTTMELANNQSGLRDYWALTVLCGAAPESAFSLADAKTLLRLNRSLHFSPGTSYSYSNGNFRILAAVIEQKVGRPFGEYLMQRVIAQTGMEHAVFAPDTAELPGDAVGYEGALEAGWRPGFNRIHWAGDAGLCGSLDDLAAWESHIDQTRNEATGVYRQLARPVTFRDGTPASYGLGLSRLRLWGRDMTGHGGAIRGWRLQRFWVPSERLSVAVAFNHESDAKGAALQLLAAALGESDALPASAEASAEGFTGNWLDTGNGLLLEVAASGSGRLKATYGGVSEPLGIGPDGLARGRTMQLTRGPGTLRIDRPADAIHTTAVPAGEPGGEDISGRYRSAEFESELTVMNVGGSSFAGFTGFLGQGPLMPLVPAGQDAWRLVCKRALDAPPPGEWTVRVLRSENGRPMTLSAGCWLARNIVFERQDQRPVA